MAAKAWLQVEFELGSLDAEALEQALTELGALAIEFRDAGDHPILEPAPGTTPLWPAVRMAALLQEPHDLETVHRAISAAIEPAAPPALRFRQIEDRDWIDQWQQGLRPLRFGARLWVCPTGQHPPDPDAIEISLDPGLAFGTGTHPTTAVCLDWLCEQPVKGQSLLDYGCGSGILAIAGLALGAARATGVDIDPQARAASQANARRNGCLDRLEVVPPADLPAARHFDIVLANILSGTLAELSPVLWTHVRPGTRVALSGILTTQAPMVRNAYRKWIDLDHSVTREDWILLNGTVTQPR